ncbi:HEPN domain-containing protein [Longimicrobium sp.]|uniref:HEPN domain-containing protein n=1 Tax=Longimicrobium sp. TaxID=2029185 RepID=UPI002C9C8BE0|nr:HEPN domain-containing protein [Longimicrobium sp.]HSU14520.1 HEPN domain-containing protein [Longimicrobium sp.]
MAFDPERWLDVAEICCSTIPGVSREALLRTALNRAYYAALLALKQRIEAVQGVGAVPAWRTHDAIKQAIRMGGDSFEEIRKDLETLRKAREQADYVLSTEDLQRDSVHLSVTRSRRLIRNRIKALPEAEFRRLRVPRG